MSSGSTTTTRGNPNKGTGGGGTRTNKQSKSDLKTDKSHNDHSNSAKVQPTAEQIQIARIMDSHRSEDPDLQKKIKQVMEVTRVTEDEACMALHSREYDTAQAITLLTDGSGQLLSSEWAQAGKKKKVKTPGSKVDGLTRNDKERGAGKEGGRERSEKRDARSDRPERERKDSEAGDGQSFGRGDERGGRGDKNGRAGGDRGSRRGGRGRGGIRVDNKENDEVNGGSRTGYGGSGGGFRMQNGPGRGRGGSGRGRGIGGRDGPRTFARTRRDEDSGYHNTIDVWENSQADSTVEKPPLKVDKWDEFPSAEDWDNEEYTGSLQETKVFTPSTLNQTQIAPPLGDTTNGGPNHLSTSVSPGLGDVKISSVGSGDALGDSSVVPTLSSGPPPSIVPGQSIDLSLLLQKPPPQNSSNATVSNAGANLLATLQSSYSNASQVQISNQQNPNQHLPQRHKVQPQRPRGPTTKIPSSAVEMPVDSVTTLDVQFGVKGEILGSLEFDDNSTMSFNSVIRGGSQNKTNADILYGHGSPPSKLQDSSVYSVSAAEKEVLGGNSNSNKGSDAQGAPFQSRNPQSSIVESSIVSSSTVPNISPNIDSHSLSSLQNQKTNTNPPQSSYVNSSNVGVGSAFVSYGKGAPGFAAPSFPHPVSAQVPPPPGAVSSYSNSASNAIPIAGNGNSPVVVPNSYTSPPNSQTSYHGLGSLSSYGTQPVVSVPTVNQQPIIASVSQSVSSSYTAPSQQQQQTPTPTYHHNTNSSVAPTYGNTATGANQYGNYSQKLGSTLSSAQSVSSTATHGTATKDSSSDSNSSVPASGSSSANSVQIGSLQQQQQGSVIASSTSSSYPKISTSSSHIGGGGSGSATASGAKMGIPPGMVMGPQYILNQSGVPAAFYSLQPQFYGYDENMQILPRLPHGIQGYYDPNAANYGNPMSFIEAAPNSGVPGGVSTRNDGTALPSFSGGSDGRFPRSDSSTASPVPSNIAGQNTGGQPMYNPGPGIPGYYFVGNNMMHTGAHFPTAYAPPHMYPTTAMATPTNASGAPHAATANHQYQNKGVYTPGYSYEGPQGPSTDFSKNSYTGGGGNSNTGKSASSGSSSGTSQTTDLNSSMYGKGHLNKVNYNEKPYVNSGGGYNQLGAGTNPLSSQLSGAGMGTPYGALYIAQQPVTSLPQLPQLQDGSNVNVSRQGSGQPKGNKGQYGAGQGGPYWPN